MVAQLVHIAKFASWRNWTVGIIAILNHRVIQFIWQTPFEVKPAQVQPRQLIRQQVKIPGALVELVVQQSQLTHLFRRQVIHADAGHFLQSCLLRAQDTPMPDDDHAVGINHHRLDEPVAPDTLRQV